MAPASLNERWRKFAQGLPKGTLGHFAPPIHDLGDGDSDITGTGVRGSWYASWRLSAMFEGRAIELCTDGTQIVAL